MTKEIQLITIPKVQLISIWVMASRNDVSGQSSYHKDTWENDFQTCGLLEHLIVILVCFKARSRNLSNGFKVLRLQEIIRNTCT